MKQFHITDVKNFPSYTVVTLAADSFGDQVHFWAGQYAAIAYKAGWQWTPARCLSFSSSPSDSAHIQFAFRRIGPFTQGLSRMKAGTPVRLQGPFGQFTLTNPLTDTVMIAGGIGVAPFISMLREAAQRQDGGKIVLIHAVKNLGDMPFYQELEQLRQQSQRIAVYYFVTSQLNGTEPEHFIQGPFNAEHARELTEGDFSYYLCGPESFMDSVSQLLTDEGVLSESIATESFASDRSSEVRGRMSLPKLTYGVAAALLVLTTGGVATYDIAKNSATASPAVQTTGQSVNNSNTTPTEDTDTPAPDTTVPQPTYTPPVSRIS